MDVGAVGLGVPARGSRGARIGVQTALEGVVVKLVGQGPGERGSVSQVEVFPDRGFRHAQEAGDVAQGETLGAKTKRFTNGTHGDPFGRHVAPPESLGPSEWQQCRTGGVYRALAADEIAIADSEIAIAGTGIGNGQESVRDRSDFTVRDRAILLSAIERFWCPRWPDERNPDVSFHRTRKTPTCR